MVLNRKKINEYECYNDGFIKFTFLLNILV